MTATQQQLTHLETVGLIKLAQAHPELEFMFRHALVQEAAYHSLLIEDRKKLHRQVGEAIEQTYPERLEEFAAVLGNHFEIAGENQRALKYFTLAGDMAMDLYANAEAISAYRHALKLAKQEEATSEKLIQLYTGLGRALELNSQYDQALANYREMAELARQRSDHTLELASLMARVTIYAVQTPVHDPTRAQALSEQALTLAYDLGNQTAQAKTLWNLTLLHMYTGHPEQAIAYAEQSLALARQLNLREQMACTLSDMARCYWMSGRLIQAEETLNEVRELWQELDDLPMLADSLALSCTVFAYTGAYNQALAFSEQALQISQSIGNLWGQSYSQYMVGHIYWERGQPDRAIRVMEESIRLSELSGFNLPQVVTRAFLAALYGELGAVKQGLETGRLALAAAGPELTPFSVYPLGILAQLHLLDGNLVEAKKAIDQSRKVPNWEMIFTMFMPVVVAEARLVLKQGDHTQTIAFTDTWLDTARQVGMLAYIPTLLHIQAQALLALGQREAARECLLEARTEAEAMGIQRMLWQILTLLAETEAGRGNPIEAEALRQQAREIVEYIITHIDQPDLRRSFLNLPEVQALLDQ